MVYFDLKKVSILKLSEENLRLLGDFDCGDDDLNSFIVDDALSQQKFLANVTYLFLSNGKLIAYCALSTDSINFTEKFEEKRRLSEEGIGYSTLPAVKIARLAVCREYQKKYGVGTSIIKWVFGGTLELSDSVGCRYVTADVKRESTGFYEKLDFKHLLSEKEEEKRSYLPVYFDLIVLKKSKGS